MTDQCFDPQDLDLIVHLPADDPRRVHLADCPQCRGLVAAMEAFIEPGDTNDLEGLTGADAELTSRLAVAMPHPRSFSHHPRRRRIGLAVAAALALCAIGLTASDVLRLGSDQSVLPGQYQRGSATETGVLVTASPSELHLVWPDAPDAEAMVYTFLSHDMSELGRIHSPGALSLHTDNPLALAPFCQALAVAQGDTIGRSGISRLSPDRE